MSRLCGMFGCRLSSATPPGDDGSIQAWASFTGNLPCACVSKGGVGTNEGYTDPNSSSTVRISSGKACGDSRSPRPRILTWR